MKEKEKEKKMVGYYNLVTYGDNDRSAELNWWMSGKAEPQRDIGLLFMGIRKKLWLRGRLTWSPYPIITLETNKILVHGPPTQIQYATSQFQLEDLRKRVNYC